MLRCTIKTLLFSLLIISLGIASCGINKAYISALKTDTKQGYLEYLKKHPGSKYEEDINRKISFFQDQEDWYKANTVNTISSYENYIKAHPSGNYILEAESRKEQLQKKLNEEIKEKKMEADWEKAVSDGTALAYQNFVTKYPISKYAVIARANISRLIEIQNTPKKTPEEVFIPMPKEDSLEVKQWNRAKRINTIKSYKDYISKYPFGNYLDQAEKAIIDLEVSIIMSGKHGTLPAPQRTQGSEYSVSTSTGIRISNNTKYTLTVYYSGASSNKIVLYPGSKQTVTLAPGRYSVAAKANDPSVIPFAGTYKLEAGEYNESFYIKTELR